MLIKTTPNTAESSLDNTGHPEGGVAEASADSDATLQELLHKGCETVRKLDSAIRQEPNLKPEVLAEWDAIMLEYADVLAEDAREAEEAELDRELREHMDRISADMDWLASLDPMDLQTNLEAEETLARNLAAWNELDAIMRLRCRDFPDKLAKWEEGVMKLVRKNEAMFEAGMAAEKAKPEN